MCHWHYITKLSDIPFSLYFILYILNGCRATKNTYLIVSILMSRASIQNLPFSVYFFPHKNQLRCQRHPPIRLLVLIIKIFFFQTRTEVHFTECVYTKRCPSGTDINYRKCKNCSLIIITLLITHFKSKYIWQLCNTPIFNLLMNGISQRIKYMMYNSFFNLRKIRPLFHNEHGLIAQFSNLANSKIFIGSLRITSRCRASKSFDDLFSTCRQI